MPVQEEIVSIDLRTVKRMWGSQKRALPTPEEIQDYMDSHGIISLDDLKILQDKIAKRIKEAESGWFKSILNSLWYMGRKHFKIDIKTLYWLMSNFDVVADHMPNEFWKSVILAIDKCGETLLAKEKEK